MMGARLKRNCKMCNKRSNLSFDPKNLLCVDCLVIWRDEVVSQHKRGKITFQETYETIIDRCRMTEFEVLDLVFPPLGDEDFQNDRMALKLNFDLDAIDFSEVHEDE